MLENTSNEEKVPIGGWLIVVGILLWAGTIFYGLSTLVDLIIASAVDIPGAIVGGIFRGIGVVFNIILLVKFHRRKASFVKWIFIYEAFSLLRLIYDTYFNVVSRGATALTITVQVVIGLLEITVIVLYFLRSKRVKRTFVR